MNRPLKAFNSLYAAMSGRLPLPLPWKNDRYILLILGAGLVVQLTTAITQVGHFHSDQHFQIIEFSSYQLGLPNSAGTVWEFEEKIRPTAAVYLLSGIRKAYALLSINDVYTQMLGIRLLVALASFALFNTLLFRCFAKESKGFLYLLVVVANLSWAIPYTRTLYSSEALSSLFFFAAVGLLDRKKTPNGVALIGIGGLLAIAFFMRFQIAFAGLGLLVWIVAQPSEKVKKITFIGLGFVALAALNIALDSRFYDTFVITPWRYFAANIIEGKASSFGESSFFFYWGVLLLMVFAPPLSVGLVIALVYGMVKRPKNLYLLCIFFFLIGHSLVGHKEERFLFPILGILPIGIGVGMQALRQRYGHTAHSWKRFGKTSLIFSATINVLLIALLMGTPYAQNVAFTKTLNRFFAHADAPTTVYCIKRTPYETQSRLPLAFYQHAANPLIRYQIVEGPLDVAHNREGSTRYLCSSFNEWKERPDKTMTAKAMTPVLYSSDLLWRLNEWLERVGINTIANVRVLYRIEDNSAMRQPEKATSYSRKNEKDRTPKNRYNGNVAFG